MTGCPDDADLRQLIAGAEPPSGTDPVEAHLGACGRCRGRLDELARVGAVGAVLMRAGGRPRVESSGLLAAIKQLQSEANSLLDTSSAASCVSTLTSVLPVLQPTTRSGFIGKLGAIEIRRVIGRGGMGVVFEGLDPALNRTVAVKVLSPHLLADDAARERFHREAQAVAALAHENVVAIHAIDRTADGVPYLVLQHVSGESLADLLARQTRLPAEEVARIGAEIARGLAAAHACGLVHRDIKPANALLEQDTGRVRLTDFGLAKVVGGENITGVGSLAGTPAFMSPEQAAGAAVDSRSDLFSLGALLYTAASGRLPFDGDSPFVVLGKVRADAPAPLTALDPALPDWFCSVVHRLLEKDPSRRIQTAAEVAERLERRAEAPAAVPGMHRRVVGAALTAVLLAGASVAGVLSSGCSTSPPGEPPAAARHGFAIVGREGRFQTLGEAIRAADGGDTIEVSGDGPIASPRIDIRGKQLTVRAAAGCRPVFVPDASARSPQWLTSDTDLTLEGIGVEWPKGEPTDEAALSRDEAAVSGRGRLTLRHCRVAGGGRMGCVACDGALTIESCHLVADDVGGGCVIWKPSGPLAIDRTALEGRGGVLVGLGVTGRSPATVTDSTFRTDSALVYLLPRPPGAAVPTSVRRCVLDTTHVVAVFFGVLHPGPPKTTAAEMRAGVRKVVAWSEGENVYRRDTSYLTTWGANRPQKPGDFKGVGDWLAFWQQREGKSIEAEIRFAPRPDGSRSAPPQLDAIEPPSGALPDRVAGRP